MVDHEGTPSLNIADLGVQHHIPLFLQMIAIEYTKAFRKLIVYTTGEESLSIRDMVSPAFLYATTLNRDEEQHLVHS